MKRKRKKSLGWFTIVLLMVASVILTVMLAIDVNNDGGGVGMAVSFDWLETLCSLLSGAASVILGVVAIVQGERANKLNEELAAIDRMQFENASVTMNYPMIKFNKAQRIDFERKELILKFEDLKKVPIKEMFVSDMHLYPYSEDYRAEEEDWSAVIQKDEEKAKVKFLTHDRQGDAEVDYKVAIKTKPELFQRYERYCLEFNLEVVNGAEVAIIYKFKLLMERVKGKRERAKVFHQFYEIEATMGEEKWEES